MKKNYNKIIAEITSARRKNNVNWMNLLKLAIKYSPTQAKKILKKINNEDKKISKLVSKLSLVFEYLIVNIYIQTEISSREEDSNLLKAIIAAKKGGKVIISDFETLKFLLEKKFFERRYISYKKLSS